MPIADVQSVSFHAASQAHTAFATNPLSGDCIVVGVSVFTIGAGTVNLPTDNLGNTYAQIGTTQVNGQAALALFRAKNVAAGATTVTVNLSGVFFAASAAWLLTGMSLNPDNNDFLVLTGNAGAVAIGPTLVVPYPGSLFIAMANIAGGNDIGDPSGWNTEGVNGFTAAMHTRANKKDWATNDDIFSAYKVSSSVQSPSWPNSPGAVNWATIIVSFAPNKTPAPTSCNPTTVATVGGDAVTISGTGFASGQTVNFAGTAATSVVVVNETTITCVSPAHAAGAVNVNVVGSDGTGTVVAGVTYAIKPVPTSITPQFVFTPASGPATIKGSGFLAGATVDFGGTSATNVVIVDAQTITCDIPAHAAGQVVVTVTNP